MIEDYSAPIRQVYSECVDRLIANIARHFPHAALDQGGTFDWETAKLAELGQLRRENLAIIAQTVGDTSGMTEIALEKAMTDALKRGAPDLLAAVKAGMLEAASPDKLSASMQGILRYYSKQAAVQTNLVNTVMLSDSLNAYRRVVARTAAAQNALRTAAQSALNTATGEVVTGISSLQTAVRNAVQQMAQEGIVGYVDKAGHNWSPDAYVEMDLRTTAGNVAREAVFQQNKEFGVDLVVVPVHAIARPGCAPYQGWVISMDNLSGVTTDASGNRVTVHPVKATSYGEPAGLWGINCSHQPDPFIPGWSESERPIEAGEVNARYEQTQKQRYHEQQVKKWKRTAVAADASGDTEAFKAAAAKVKERQTALKAYCEKTGLPFSSDRTQVFGYNKSVSGKAVAAVKKPATVTAGGSPVVLVKKTDLQGAPNSITQVNGKHGAVTRNFYDATGLQRKQISNTNHGNPKHHTLGARGEHAHDYYYAEDGTVSRPNRELTDQERKENADIL